MEDIKIQFYEFNLPAGDINKSTTIYEYTFVEPSASSPPVPAVENAVMFGANF